MIEVPLTQGQTAIIDDEDWEMVSRHKWQIQRASSTSTDSFYAITTVLDSDRRRKKIFMHRLIMRPERGQDVDHLDHNTLDNRKSQLRLCSHSQNLCNSGKHSNNTSGYKGVCWDKRRRKWRAQSRVNGKQTYLGLYATAELAHAAYCRASNEFHGEFGRTA